MSDTPMTDAERAEDNGDSRAAYDFAAGLERGLSTITRERDEARAALEEARANLAEWEDSARAVAQDRPDEVHCACAAVLRKERDEAIACLREACECYEADADRVELHIRRTDPLARWRRAAGMEDA